MNKIMTLVIGIIIGIFFVAVIGWLVMPKLMLNEGRSPYDLEKTIETIKQNAIKEGWVIASVKPLHQSIVKHGGAQVLPVYLINLCEANHASNILKEDKNRLVSVMMPCTITVYEKSDGKVYVGRMNAGLLGKMFGGTVAKVMGKTVATQQNQFVDFLLD